MGRRRFLYQAMGACFLVSCQSGSSHHAQRLTVSAAASMQDVLTEIRTAYGAIHPGVEIVYNFGASGSLTQQIIQGAPVDVFLSAAVHWLDRLEQDEYILKQSRQALVQNSMVLVVPRGREDIRDFRQLATANRIAMGEPDSVPAGHYGKQVLMSLGLFEQVRAKLVFGKNVRHVLSYVETGNVDAGLVYGTDARGSDRVRLVAMAPAGSHGAIIYGVAVVTASVQRGVAQTWVDFLLSPAATAIFQDYGFAAAG